MYSIKHRRPLFVTILCSFYFVYWVISMVSLIAALLMRIGGQFPKWSEIFNQVGLTVLGIQINMSVVAWLIVAGLIIGVIGYWFLQRWAVIVYAAATVALFILALPPAVNVPSKTMYAAVILYNLAAVFTINIAVIVVGIIYFKRMK